MSLLHTPTRRRGRHRLKEPPRKGDFGGRVRWLYEWHYGESQEAFVARLQAAGCDIAKSNLSAWWGHKNKPPASPSLHHVVSLWRALAPDGVSLRWLVTGEEPEFDFMGPEQIAPALARVLARTHSSVVPAALHAFARAWRLTMSEEDWALTAREFENVEAYVLRRVDPKRADRLGSREDQKERDLAPNFDRIDGRAKKDRRGGRKKE